MIDAQINQQGWTHGGSWNVEDGPGPKGVTCGKGRSMSQINDGIEVLTNSDGAIQVIRIWPKRMLKPMLQNCENDGHVMSQRVRQVVQRYNTGNQSRAIYRAHTLPWEFNVLQNMLSLPGRRAAKGTVNVDKCRVSSVTLTEPGIGYRVGDKPWVKFSQPETRPAKIQVHTNQTGTISAIDVLDGGAGYSCVAPATFTFPTPPPQRVRSYNLQVKPVNTYENINNNYFFKTGSTTDGSPDLVGLNDLQNERCDIYNTEQTYLGQGKSHFDQGQRTTASQGGYEGAPDRYGPCHFVNHGENIAGEVVTHNQYKTHGWYVTGVEHETNSQYCGTAFLSAANQMSLVRTYDFYMELQPVTYTEIGFKESPAARELFSRIALEDPIYLCPGQFLRLTYQLLITFEPGDVPRYKEVPAEGDWYNGVNANGVKVLSGYECLQGNGMCVVGQDGVANPYDITGVANEPFAPGSTNLGPQYGYVNRWKNGDTRLSHPTYEYNNDADNPWILGGDQMNPPDWAAKFWDSPTVNYMPRDFKTYIEWPSQTMSVPDPSNTDAKIKWNEIAIPSGPEMTLERDAFDHWFTKAPPSAKSTITFTNFAANNGDGKGRWDFLITKGYLTDVYPNLLTSNTVYQDIKDQQWIQTYRFGEPIPSTPSARSQPGVFMGPVIPYTGRDGALHDPVSVLGSKITRNVSALKHPYGGHYIVLLDPVNTGIGEYEQVTISYPICPAGVITYTSGPFCYRQLEPLNRNQVDTDYAWLEERQNYYGFGSTKSSDVYPVDPRAGGGVFTRLDSWAPWTHTPLVTSYDVAATIGPERLKYRPDTAGNWSQAEAIPVAGASAWISTSDEDFAEVGKYVNRSHTLFGAVCGQPGVDNKYDGNLSFETPCYFIGDYVRGSGKRIKRAVFETSFANLTAVKCLGIGPTSTTLMPHDMTDAPRFNTYVFKFGEVNSANNDPSYKGFDNLSTYKLTLDFKYVWYRNLKI